MMGWTWISLVACIQFCVLQAALAKPRVVPTERYQREMRRLMIVEANRVARELNLDEQLPIVNTNLTHVFLMPAGKTDGALGVIDTRNYAYTMRLKDFGVVAAGVVRKGYQDFHKARAEYVWPKSRCDTNHAFQIAVELMARAGIDANGLNRDCRVFIDAPDEGHFSPIYMVAWIQRANTFHVRAGENVACIEFIEPVKRIRQLTLTPMLPGSKYNLRKPAETVDFLYLLTPENSREAVLHAIELGTNYVKQIEDLKRFGLSAPSLVEIWREYTNAPFPTTILQATNGVRLMPNGRSPLEEGGKP